MSYETLIRRIYQCGRSYKDGADAVIFRDYEEKKNLYEKQKEAIEKKEPLIWNASLDDLEYDMRVAMLKVARNVEQALLYAEKEYRYKLDKQQLKELKECREKVSVPWPEELVKTMDRSNEILFAVGL